MVLKESMRVWNGPGCIGMIDSSDGPEIQKKKKMFRGKCSGFHKLLRQVVIWKSFKSGTGFAVALLWHLLPGYGWGADCEGVVMCLAGRFLSFLSAVTSKFACRHFLGSAMSSVFNVGVGGISGAVGGAFGRKDEAVQVGQLRILQEGKLEVI